jgi:glycosyltransferase involved in cell wall biosynthesis
MICSPSWVLHGGVESIVNDLCRHLPSRGWNPVLALAKGARFNNVDRYRATHPGLPIIELDGTRGTRQARIESLTRQVRRVRPDVIMNARIYDTYAAMAEFKQKQDAPRLVTTIRVFEPEYFHDAQVHRGIVDLCLVSGNLLAATAAWFTGIAPERIISIPGGVHGPDEPAIPRQTPGIVRLGYVARFCQEQKRVFDLVATLETLERMGVGFSLLVAGAGPEETELKSRLHRFLNNGSVTWCGWVSRQHLYTEIYPNLDCLVHFARFEGVTIAPREAMAHGVVPVIAEFPGLKCEKQFLHNVNSLTFPVGNTVAAAEHIQRLATEPGLITRLSKEAIRSQSGAYSFEGNIDAWAAAFDYSLELPSMSGPVPKPRRANSGRLARMGVPPWLAQRVRDLAGIRPVYDDPGGEWPAFTRQITRENSEALTRFAQEYEDGLDG